MQVTSFGCFARRTVPSEIVPHFGDVYQRIVYGLCLIIFGNLGIETGKINSLMKKTSIIQTAKAAAMALAVTVGFLGAVQAQGQSVTYTFSDGTNDGWASSGFSSTPVVSVSTIGGLNYIYVPFAGFQSGNVASDSPGNLAGFNAAMSAALLNPAGYAISYNYYINTANITGATFLQLGVFVNTGKGYYQQDYSTPNQVSFNGTQLTSGQIFTGTVTESLATMGVNDTNALSETYFRLGLIENTTSGATGGVYFTDISITPVPEPASIALCGLGLASGYVFLRRRKA